MNMLPSRRFYGATKKMDKVYPISQQLWHKIPEKRGHPALHKCTPIKYEVTNYWIGSLYIGITLKWDYKSSILDISVARYVKESLHKFHHLTPVLPQHYHHQWKPPNYGSTAPQMSHQALEYPKISPPEANTLQQVVVTFLYYALIFNTTILVPLNSITA